MAINNQSPYSGRGLFRAALKSYDSSQNCLVSTLIFHATVSRNRTRVMCTNDNKSSNQSLSLHIMSELTLHDTFLSVLQGQGSLIISFSSLGWQLAGHVCLIFTNWSLPTPIHQQRCNSKKKVTKKEDHMNNLNKHDEKLICLANAKQWSPYTDITLEHLTVVPVSLSTVLLEWKVVPTDGHHCIKNYNIQVSGPNGSQLETKISGNNHPFPLKLSEMQLIPSVEYTYCVTANISSTQASPTAKLTSTVNLQGM